MKKFGTPELDRILQRLDELTAQFFGLFGEGDRRVAFTGRDAFREDNEEIYTDLLAALELIGSHLKLLQNPPEEIIPLFRRTQELNEGLRFIMEEDDENFVYWVEKRGRGCFLQATPIDVSGIVSQAAVRPGGYGGADLAPRSPWRAVSISREKRLGLENARTLVVPGHFDYQKQALLYVPQHLPEPKNPAFTKMAAEEVVQHSGAQPRARLRPVHQLSADAAGVRQGVASKSTTRR